MQALILAGGLGTRLRKLVNDRPKPMALINEKPFLEYIIVNLRNQGIKDIILAVGYMYEFIENYFEDGKKFGVNIDYSIEEEQLGTGGAIKNAQDFIKHDNILILNGDTYFNVDYTEMLKEHEDKKALFTMALRKIDNVERYGTVEFDDEGRITGFIEKGKKAKSNYINGGIYIIKNKILDYIKENENISLEKEVIPKMLETQKLYKICCENYFIDIGIPEDYLKFENDVLGGKVNDN